ncbi:MAG: hypothetical protein AAGE52_37395 [Myxococcota bacterium]
MRWWIAIFVAGCAARQTPAPTTGAGLSLFDFPSEAEVEALGAEPQPLIHVDATAPTPVEWTMAGVPPRSQVEGPHEHESEAGAAVTRFATSRENVRTTAAMACFARELARLYLRDDQVPSVAYRRFLASRCGATMPRLRLIARVVGSGVDLGIEAAEVVDSIGEAEMIEVGAAIAEDAVRRVGVVVGAPLEAQLMAVRPVPNQRGHVRLGGRLLVEADAIEIAITRGPYAVRRCALNRAVALPMFDALCPMHPGDSFAAISIRGLRRGRLLSLPIASILARRRGEEDASYRPTSGGTPAELDSPEAFTEALVERINGVRAARLRPLRHAPRQSATLRTLAPHYLRASTERNDAGADEVVCAMIAGWDVGIDDIRGADFLGLSEFGPRDPAQWLSAALAQPGGRFVLLDPDVQQLAIGVLPIDGGVNVVVATFARFEGFDRDAAALVVFDRIAAARESRGLPPPTLVVDYPALDEEFDRVRSGKTPMNAIRAATREAAQSWRRGVGGFIYEAGHLPSAEVPDALLQPGRLFLSITVTYRRAREAPWAHYVVGIL